MTKNVLFISNTSYSAPRVTHCSSVVKLSGIECFEAHQTYWMTGWLSVSIFNQDIKQIDQCRRVDYLLLLLLLLLLPESVHCVGE